MAGDDRRPYVRAGDSLRGVARAALTSGPACGNLISVPHRDYGQVTPHAPVPHELRTIDVDDFRADDVAVARRGVATFGAPHHGARTATDKLRDFVHRYGWRAYALPVLSAVTLLALATTDTGAAGPAAARGAEAGTVAGRHAGKTSPGADAAPVRSNAVVPGAPGEIDLKVDAPGEGAQNEALPADALPSGPAYTEQGAGTFRTLPGTSPVVGSGNLRRYRIEVENGVTGVNLSEYVQLIETVLADQRSWAGHDGLALQRVDSGPVDFAFSLTSSMTVRDLCGYDIQAETSCYAETTMVPELDVNRVVLNVARWVRGDANYVGDLHAYRIYMINHEGGHALGHGHAHQCLPDGLAPIMMQQTLGLKSAATGKMCQANPWPYPPGVRGTPGEEQPDTMSNSPMMN